MHLIVSHGDGDSTACCQNLNVGIIFVASVGPSYLCLGLYTINISLSPLCVFGMILEDDGIEDDIVVVKILTSSTCKVLLNCDPLNLSPLVDTLIRIPVTGLSRTTSRQETDNPVAIVTVNELPVFTHLQPLPLLTGK